MAMDPKAPAIVRWREESGNSNGHGRREAEKTFPSLAEGARFVAEELDPAVRHSATIECGDGGLSAPEILFFYRCTRADH